MTQQTQTFYKVTSVVTGWGVGTINFYYFNNIDRANQFCTELQTKLPGAQTTVESATQADMDSDIESFNPTICFDTAEQV